MRRLVSFCIGIAVAASGIRAGDMFPKPLEIRPAGKYPVIANDYFTSVLGKPCDFNTDGHLCRVAGFGAGVRDVQVEGGSLHFTARADDAYLYFGRWLYPEGDRNIPDENIGVGWRTRYEKIRLIMRVKQSRDESVWQVNTRCLHGGIGNVPGRVGPTPSRIQVKGRDWQEVSVPLIFDRGGNIRALSLTVLPMASLSTADREIETEDPKDDPGGLPPLEEKGKGRDLSLENRISIDYIKAANVTTPVFYRKTVVLNAEPVRASLRVNLRTEHSIYVNGRRAHYYRGYLNKGGNPAVDIASFLHKGRNVIAVGAPNTYWVYGDAFLTIRTTPYSELVCAGTILDRDGSFVSLHSDASWKASYNEEPDWERPGFDDSRWQPATAKKHKPAYSQYGLAPRPTHYVGPILPQGWEMDPIFRLDDGIDLSFVLPKNHRLDCTLTDALTGEAEQQGRLPADPASGALQTHRLRHKPDQPGVWHAALRLTDGSGRLLAQRTMEAAVVGPIKQKRVRGDSFTEGMDLRLLVDIDCTKADPVNAATAVKPPEVGAVDEGDAEEEADDDLDGLEEGDDAEEAGPRKAWAETYLYTFYAGPTRRLPSTAVVDGPAGRYRVTDTTAFGGFGYMFSVEKLHTPHLIEVEYPDDAERLIMAKVFCLRAEEALQRPETHDWGKAFSFDQRWYSGVATGGARFPVENRFKKLYLIFWPDGHPDLNTIQIMTEEQGGRAAARRIRVYEIDDLPALDLPDTPRRLYGLFNEREHLAPQTFYSGAHWPPFRLYGNSYIDRLGRLRDWYVTCQNIVKYMRFSGQNLYVPGYYMYMGTYFPETRGQARGPWRHPTDHFRLMAAMFEENELYLMLGTQYCVSAPPMAEGVPTNWEVLNEGKESVLGVTLDGRQSLLSGSASSGAMDYLDPRVEADLKSLVDLYLEYGKEYQSVRGIWFYTAWVGFPTIPVVHTFPPPLNSALAWQLNDRSVRRFEAATGESFAAGRRGPDRFRQRYDFLLSHPKLLGRWISFRCEQIHAQLVRLMKQAQAVRPDWRLYIMPTGPAPFEEQAAKEGRLTFLEATRRRGYDMNLYREEGIVNALNNVLRHARLSGEPFGQCWNPKDSVYYVNRWPTPAHSHSVYPAEPYAAYDWMRCLRQAAPEVLIYGKSDVVMISGGEQKMRPFIRTFRSLPAGRYTTRRGDAFTDQVAVRELRNDEGHYVYLVNPGKTARTVAAGFDREVALAELGTGQAAGRGTQVEVVLAPYSMRAFAIAPGNAELRSVLLVER